MINALQYLQRVTSTICLVPFTFVLQRLCLNPSQGLGFGFDLFLFFPSFRGLLLHTFFGLFSLRLHFMESIRFLADETLMLIYVLHMHMII